MKHRGLTICLIALLFVQLGSGLNAVAADPPKVVATIKPIQGLAAAIMQGVGTPELLLDRHVSPHDYAMRPSDASALQSADLVLWIGPGLETFLATKLKVLAREARILRLGTAAGIQRLPVRNFGHDHSHDHDHGVSDPHIWLDPVNAKAMASAIAVELTDIDPARQDTYKANLTKLHDALDRMIEEIQEVLKPVQGRAYLTQHDAFQYFEKRFAMPGSGAISATDDRAPTIRHLQKLRKKIRQNDIVCVFVEPKGSRKHAIRLLKGTATKTAVLDPLGINLTSGADFYATHLRQIAQTMGKCLS